ncbi:hypothetical protein U9M48_011701, partial [Paspalum notatum var. saurae]
MRRRCSLSLRRMTDKAAGAFSPAFEPWQHGSLDQHTFYQELARKRNTQKVSASIERALAENSSHSDAVTDLTWSNVAIRTSNSRHCSGVGNVNKFGQTKVPHMSLHHLINEYVVRFDITVNDLRFAIAVEIPQAFSSAQSNP